MTLTKLCKAMLTELAFWGAHPTAAALEVPAPKYNPERSFNPTRNTGAAAIKRAAAKKRNRKK